MELNHTKLIEFGFTKNPRFGYKQMPYPTDLGMLECTYEAYDRYADYEECKGQDRGRWPRFVLDWLPYEHPWTKEQVLFQKYIYSMDDLKAALDEWGIPYDK